MKNNFKKIIVLFIFISTFVLNSKIEASSVVVKSLNVNPGIGEQFVVDLLLDTEGETINGIEGSVSFSSDVFSFVRAEEGSSIINLWIERPNLDGNKINFSGIIPNGFSGVIDPFNPSKKDNGLIIRLILESKKEGIGNISSSLNTTLNDGLGTVISVPLSSIDINAGGFINSYIHKTDNDTKPELSAYISRDQNIYNNKYFLVYDAKDSLTGIKEVLIKEGNRSWKKINSPYLLEDQERHSIITLQATNYSDSSIAVSIEPLPYKIFSLRNIYITIFVLLILLFIIKKIHEKYKKIHN